VTGGAEGVSDGGWTGFVCACAAYNCILLVTIISSGDKLSRVRRQAQVMGAGAGMEETGEHVPGQRGRPQLYAFFKRHAPFATNLLSQRSGLGCNDNVELGGGMWFLRSLHGWEDGRLTAKARAERWKKGPDGRLARKGKGARLPPSATVSGMLGKKKRCGSCPRLARLDRCRLFW